jgi:single-strand DNA-binding protein
MRSLNKVELIGNVTRDPEVRFTPAGKAVCTFSIATNRQWKTDTGDSKEEAEFHRIVAWDKLAETIGQYIKKGAPIYVEGRLQTRKWTDQAGVEKSTTEIVINNMIMLSSRGGTGTIEVPDNFGDAPDIDAPAETSKPSAKPAKTEAAEIDDSDIPF